MSEVAQVAALVCALSGKPPECHMDKIRPKDVATFVIRAVNKYPSVTTEEMVLMLRHESWFDPEARGVDGELGMAQLFRGTIATKGYDHLSDRQLMQPELNIRLGARHLARIKASCGVDQDNPRPVAFWIGRYSGAPCGRTKYGRLAAQQLAEAHRILRRYHARQDS